MRMPPDSGLLLKYLNPISSEAKMSDSLGYSINVYALNGVVPRIQIKEFTDSPKFVTLDIDRVTIFFDNMGALQGFLRSLQNAHYRFQVEQVDHEELQAGD